MRPSLRPLAAALILLAAAPSAFVMTGAALAQQQPAAGDQEVKQVALTAKQIDNYLAAKKEMDALTDKAPDTGDKPDPAFLAQLDAGAKKHGFADYSEYDDVSNNVGLAMDGIDPQAKKYVGSETMLKKELAGLQADKQMPAKDKKEAMDQITAALKNPPNLQFPANADLVVKNYDKLMAAMPQQ